MVSRGASGWCPFGETQAGWCLAEPLATPFAKRHQDGVSQSLHLPFGEAPARCRLAESLAIVLGHWMLFVLLVHCQEFDFIAFTFGKRLMSYLSLGWDHGHDHDIFLLFPASFPAGLHHCIVFSFVSAPPKTASCRKCC